MVIERRNVTDGVLTVVAEPVIQAKAEPGTIMNHAQGAFPEIEALGQRANSHHALMPAQEEIDERMTQRKQDPTTRNKQRQPTSQQHLAITNRQCQRKES